MPNDIYSKYPDVFDSTHWGNIECEVFETIKPIVSLKIKSKLMSELISELNEKIAAKYFKRLYGKNVVKCATNDNDPDITIGNFPLEIKVAKRTISGIAAWRGGTFSKREGDFIFIVWDFIDNLFEYSVYTCYLTKNDWQVSKYNNYYATNYNLKLMRNNPTYRNIVGDIVLSKRNIPKPQLVNLCHTEN